MNLWVKKVAKNDNLASLEEQKMIQQLKAKGYQVDKVAKVSDLTGDSKRVSFFGEPETMSEPTFRRQAPML